MHEIKTENSLDFKNMLLAINSDSTAVYSKCFVSKSISRGEHTSSSRSSSVSVSLPSAALIELTDSALTLQQEMLIFNFKYELAVTKAPYRENGRWYIGIDDTLLTKLEGDELNGFTLPECPNKDDEGDKGGKGDKAAEQPGTAI